MIIASLPEDRWVAKAAGWNPELSMQYKNNRVVGRPRKRWEDEINDFLRPERIENAINNIERNNNGWIKTEKDQMRMESKFSCAAAAAPGSQHKWRRR